MASFDGALPSQDVLSGYNNFNYVDGAPTNDSCNVTRYVMGLSIAAGVTYGQTFDVRGVLLNKQAVYITCTFVGAYESGGITQFAKFKRGAFLANAKHCRWRSSNCSSKVAPPVIKLILG